MCGGLGKKHTVLFYYSVKLQAYPNACAYFYQGTKNL